MLMAQVWYPVDTQGSARRRHAISQSEILNTVAIYVFLCIRSVKLTVLFHSSSSTILGFIYLLSRQKGSELNVFAITYSAVQFGKNFIMALIIYVYWQQQSKVLF